MEFRTNRLRYHFHEQSFLVYINKAFQPTKVKDLKQYNYHRIAFAHQLVTQDFFEILEQQFYSLYCK